MPITDSLISYWRQNEAANATALDSYGSNNLTDENGVASAAGKGTDNARLFVAANSEDFVRASNASLQTGDIDYTIACRVYLDDLTTVQTLMSKYGDTTNLEYVLYFLGAADATRRFAFAIDDIDQNETILNADTFGPPALHTWYDIRAWHDSVADTLNIQVNNTAADSVSYSAGSIATNAPFRLGALGDTPGLFFSGRIDEAAFWKRVLTGGEWTTLISDPNGYGLSASALGFDGVIPLGFYALMPNWSTYTAPSVGAERIIWRASYAIYHQRSGA